MRKLCLRVTGLIACFWFGMGLVIAHSRAEDSVVTYPSGGAQDLLNLRAVPPEVSSAGVERPVGPKKSSQDEPHATCRDLSGKTWARGEAGYERCMRNTAIRQAPGAPQGIPGSSETSVGIPIRTH